MNVLSYTPPSQPRLPMVDVPRDLVLDFGKRKGLSVSWLAEHDMRYALWLMGQGFVIRRPELWLCLRKHVTPVLHAQEAEFEAGRLA